MITPEIYHNYKNLFIKNLEDEFDISSSFDSSFIEELCYDGLLPMGEIFNGEDLLVVKLHDERCVVYPSNVKFSKSVKRQAKRYRLTINRSFDDVIKGVWNQHGELWFTSKLYESIKPLINREDLKASYHSVELWQGKDLVAGDIGMVSGSRYLSMTGFYNLSGSGSVLLASMGRLLNKFGFDMWDLGMEMDYKLNLGAEILSRDEFLSEVERYKDKKMKFFLDDTPCVDLFE